MEDETRRAREAVAGGRKRRRSVDVACAGRLPRRWMNRNQEDDASCRGDVCR